MVISPFRFGVAALYFGLIEAGYLQGVDFSASLYGYLCVAVVCVLALFRTDYLNPLFAFCWPWLVVLSLVGLDMSELTRPISSDTVLLLLIGLGAAIAAGTIVPSGRESVTTARPPVDETRAWAALIRFFGVYLILLVVQIAVAGFVPLIRGIQTGTTGYMEFGIHSINGFFNALSCAIAAVSFYLYCVTGIRKFAYMTTTIFVFFLILVTRQNAITIVFECCVIYFVTVRRIRVSRLTAGFAVLLIVFGLIGDFRSGDIRTIARITPTFDFVPTALIWPYAYMYFNVLNLDNALADPGYPYLDGSGFALLIPSVLRPNSDHTVPLEVGSFTVSSFYPGLVLDIGFSGVLIFLLLIFLISSTAYNRATRHKSMIWTCCFSTLYFASIFSFFDNMWVYLPVIGQIPIVIALGKLIGSGHDVATPAGNTTPTMNAQAIH